MFKFILAFVLFCAISATPSSKVTTSTTASQTTTSTSTSPTTSTPTSRATSTSTSRATSTPTSTTTSTPTSRATSTPTSQATSTPISPTTSTPTSRATSTPKPQTPTASQSPTTRNTSTEPTEPSTTPLEPTTPPPPSPPTAIWNVSSSENGSVCILAEFAATFRIVYNSSIKNRHPETGFNLPGNAVVNQKESNCNISDTQVLVLNFEDQNQTMGGISLTFNMTKDNTIIVESVKLVFNLTEEIFPGYINPKDYNKMVTAENNSLAMFSVSKSQSYKCDSQTSVVLANVDPDFQIERIELDITNAQVQAYVQDKSTSFSDAAVCQADNKVQDVSSTVPIIVGAALGVLVLIVLIAFFIGKRRNSKASYSSMT